MSSKAKFTNACCSSHKEHPESNCMMLKNFNRFNSTIWIIFTVFSVDRAIIAIVSFADKIFSLKNIWYYRVLLAFVDKQIAFRYYILTVTVTVLLLYAGFLKHQVKSKSLVFSALGGDWIQVR